MRRAFLFVLLAALPFFAGCGTVKYYAQATRGQLQVLHRKQPIQKLLADTNTPPTVRERLTLLLSIRDFAEKELRLPANGHYQHYADLKRRFAVWNVYAAPEFSLAAKTWWYPVVGRLEYRGYFDERAARREAARLAARGYDVHVGGVTAYSTLGWFHDPALNTFLFKEDVELAELIFHELAHQRLFIAGDTDFNEAFATAVAEEGVERWLRARGDGAAITRQREATAHQEIFLRLVARARAELEALYPAGPGGDCTCGRRREKEAVFERLRRDYATARTNWGGSGEYDRWFGQSLNNALLNTVETYHAFVPAFRQLLAQAGGDLERFFHAATALGKLKPEERHRRLREPAP